MDITNLKLAIELVLSFMLFLVTTAAFFVSFFTYRDTKKPIVSLILSRQDDWIVLHIKNTGRGEAQNIIIDTICNTKKNTINVSYLPPEVTYVFKLEPYAIVETLPYVDRIVTISYSYVDNFKMRHTKNNLPIQISL